MNRDRQILDFFTALKAPSTPRGVQVLNPYKDAAVMDLCRKFYGKYYHDDGPRHLILGINPGRWGAGLTGIPFTDPVRLQEVCGIPNDLKKNPELSSDFVYRMVEAMGGPELFYRHFYISSVCPLGFTRDAVNLNYYDLPALSKSVRKYAAAALEQQLTFGISRDVCFCLGEGKNADYLRDLNSDHVWFGRIVAMPHPRFIMQYRRKQLAEYIGRYQEAFRPVLQNALSRAE